MTHAALLFYTAVGCTVVGALIALALGAWAERRDLERRWRMVKLTREAGDAMVKRIDESIERLAA